MSNSVSFLQINNGQENEQLIVREQADALLKRLVVMVIGSHGDSLSW